MAHPDHIQFINPESLAPTPGYSQIAKVTGGQTLYISGQIALDSAGNLVGRGDFRAQAQQVFENIKTSLTAAGADFSHVVKLSIFVLDRSNLPILREVRDLYIDTQTPPASTAVEVSSLFREGFLLEIDVIASIPA